MQNKSYKYQYNLNYEACHDFFRNCTNYVHVNKNNLTVLKLYILHQYTFLKLEAHLWRIFSEIC